MKNFIKVYLIMFTLLLGSIVVSAQPSGDPGDPDATQAPIDGGVSLLIAAGVAYGAKKAHEHRKNKKQQIEK